jgi:hypothetical protein
MDERTVRWTTISVGAILLGFMKHLMTIVEFRSAETGVLEYWSDGLMEKPFAGVHLRVKISAFAERSPPSRGQALKELLVFEEGEDVGTAGIADFGLSIADFSVAKDVHVKI